MGLDWIITDTKHILHIGAFSAVQRLRLTVIKGAIKYLESLRDAKTASSENKKKRKRTDDGNKRKTKNARTSETLVEKRKEAGGFDLEGAIKILKSWYDEGPPKPPGFEFGAKFDPMVLMMDTLPIKYAKIPQQVSDFPPALYHAELIALWDFVQHSDVEGSHHAEIVVDLAQLFAHISKFIENEDAKERVDDITEFLELAVENKKGIEYQG